MLAREEMQGIAQRTREQSQWSLEERARPGFAAGSLKCDTVTLLSG